ncbi:hypothetical protein C8Z91_22845 [Paenibacillus elgii]|uniref:Uncharacterized protein n=1 Tax=Paenibacillus elgii TaxID=189691 RepID=A0A2T6FYJ9_9BACL|nr:hypothetical protein C8Z91_22845 [Paenibacillus elgii]
MEENIQTLDTLYGGILVGSIGIQRAKELNIINSRGIVVVTLMPRLLHALDYFQVMQQFTLQTVRLSQGNILPSMNLIYGNTTDQQ